jgi:hypothetical protein
VQNAPQTAVRFQVTDVVHPRPSQLLAELFGHVSLQGQVVALTTAGDTRYLVCRVAGLEDAVIVPAEKAATMVGAESESAQRTGRQQMAPSPAV